MIRGNFAPKKVLGTFATSRRGLATNIVQKGSIASVAKKAIRTKTRGVR